MISPKTPKTEKPETIAESISQEKQKELKAEEETAEKVENKPSEAEKRQLELQKKKARIAAIEQSAASLGYHRGNDPLKLKIASDCLQCLNKPGLAYNSQTKAILTLKKAQVLHFLGQDKAANQCLKENWGKVTAYDPEMKKNGQFNKAPSAAAYYLKGNIELSLAKTAKDNNLAEDFGKKAVMSYYSVLNLYDANQCPFSSAAVKGFKSSRDFLVKKFKIKVGFPPEF